MATRDKNFRVKNSLEVEGSSFVNDSINLYNSNTPITLKSPDGNIFYLYAGVGGTLSTTPAGRGLFAGGYTNTKLNNIDFVQISTIGNSIDFGDLTSTKSWSSGCSSTTRGLFNGGYIGPDNFSTLTPTNAIDYITIATIGNALDFGDLTVARWSLASCSSTTRGLSAGGRVGAGSTNVLDYNTIATIGNATDFGDLTLVVSNLGGFSSTTRGVFSGGETPATNVISYVTIATTGNAIDFGDLSGTRHSVMSCSSNVRGVIAGGVAGTGAYPNTIEYITIDTTGNATDFGDLTVARAQGGGCSSSTRGLFGGGTNGPTKFNVIDFITISTTGNATDFGDLIIARQGVAALSNNHGGLG